MSALTAIGLASGSSIEGVRAVILRTDGERAVEAGPAHFHPYSRDQKIFIRRAIKAAIEGRDGAADIGKAEGELTEVHAIAVVELLERTGIKRTAIDVIGLSGHAILHRPKRTFEGIGRTWSIGDGRVLAEETGIDVVAQFRAADVAEGGEGAPLSPLYYRALAASAGRGAPLAVIELNDAATIVFIPESASDLDLAAFDCGPGTSLVDRWADLKSGQATDAGGALAMSGKVHADVLRLMLLNPYLRRRPPKFLDRHDFKIEPALSLSLADGAATLTALTAACVRASATLLPAEPREWIVAGEGRRNPAILMALEKALEAHVHVAESAGWRGDDLEAECVAYLAVRALKKLPLTFPGTTRAPRPLRGGTFHGAPA